MKLINRSVAGRILLVIGFFMVASLMDAQQKDILVTDLPNHYFGDWIGADGQIRLSTQEDYLLYRNQIWYYQQIDDYHEYVDLKLNHDGELKYIRIYLNDKNSISLEDDMYVRSDKLNRLKEATSNQISEDILGKWYDGRRKLKIENSQIVFKEKIYTADHIIATKNCQLVVAYNNGRYYLFRFDFRNGLWGLNAYLNKVIVFMPETWWQKHMILLTVMLLLLVGSIIFFMIKWRMQRERKKEVMRRRFIEMQLKTIRSQMNPHFIFNALGAIQNLIIEKKNDMANSYLISFSQLLRLTLDKSEHGVVSLEEELDSIEKYLQLEQLRFHFEYDIQIGKDVNPQQVEIPAMLIQPFVENAIIHGLNESSGDKKLTIQFDRKGEDLHIQVVDNGIGINASQTRNGIQLKQEKYGIKLAEDRLQLINDGHQTDASLKISDLSEENPFDRGTKVQIMMPITT
ncbi:MAG: histidine kinase [Carboxylicivirga sp.]|jgi:uncharacterized protein YpmS|nr:histidine kinase [Carboxylicivirga sp.]